MLRCIRCSACMNHCPVYGAIGGHAYGWVYPGPMGSVLTPQLVGIDAAGQLPNASTFCGRCEEVCPMHIPLPKMMRHWRERSSNGICHRPEFASVWAHGPFRQTPEVVPNRRRCRCLVAAATGRPKGTYQESAPGGRLDRLARPAGAAGPNLPTAMGGTPGGTAMSDAREQILNTLRRGLQRGPVAGERRAELEARLAHPPRNVIPARALRPHFEQVDLFVQMARNAATTVDPVTHPADVPVAVSAFLDCEGLPLNWSWRRTRNWRRCRGRRTSLHIERRAAVDGDQTSVSLAFAGIAETGTLVLLSGPHSPTTLNFLPDTHIVVLRADRIVGAYEDAWDLLRARGLGMPRTVNFITGPSRSADIEQTVQMGAHGPLRLHIVLVGG